MNKGQRDFAIRQLNNIFNNKKAQLDKVFEDKVTTLDTVFNHIKSIKKDEDNSSMGYTVVYSVPDSTAVDLIKAGLGSIKDGDFTISKSQYTAAVKIGADPIVKDSQKQNLFTELVRIYCIKAVKLTDIEEYNTRIKAMKEHRDNVELNMYLGNSKDVLDALSAFKEMEC